MHPTHQPRAGGPRTLLEAFGRHARRTGISRGVRLVDDRGRGTYLAYSELLVRAASAGRALDRAGLRRGQRVMILLPTCRTQLTAVVACLLRGILPVVGEPGGSWSGREDAAAEVLELAARLGVQAVVTAARRIGRLTRCAQQDSPRLLAVETLRHAQAIGAEDAAFRPRPEDPALIALTAGAKGPRRPIVLSHGNVATHLAALGDALRVGEREVLCGRTGLDTITGLVDEFLFGLFHGFDQVLLVPERTRSHPEHWVGAIASYRCTLTFGQDTDYGLCAHRLRNEALDGLDLSCLRRAITLGPVQRPGTREAFLRRFAAHGVSPHVFLPAYGLAEACGVVTLGRPGAYPLSDRFDRRSLRPGRYVHTSGVGDSRARLMMSSGMPLHGMQLAVLGPDGAPLPEGRVGRIVARGPAVAAESEEEGGAAAQSRWLDTGDLGFLIQGELFVVGRLSEGLELHGLRFDPEELEAIASEIPGIRHGGVAAFTVHDEDEPLPVVVAAPSRGLGPQRRGVLADRLGTRIGRMIGVRPQVMLVPGRSLPADSTGPEHREDCRERFLYDWDHELEARRQGG